ncbi:Exostosin-like protein [Artemisia annua]|uniref:Exostosin-like protein n=1 Tax=Artemisia annua TaxID=35608 RepID=A0A2U1QLD6_ARTAN|nr:Exostosin-like protein [Artemisia annua]
MVLWFNILKFLRNSSYCQKNSGRDYVISMHHPNAFRFLREEVNASFLIAADFGRYSKSLSNLRKDVVAPYKHVVESYLKDDPPNPFKLRKTLLCFRGRTEGKVRRKLENLLKDYEDYSYMYEAGDTPSSNRLFNAIVNHCVPVIVSDHIELPFESELDYSKIALF